MLYLGAHTLDHSLTLTIPHLVYNPVFQLSLTLYPVSSECMIHV
jgi:hypothetical protein